MSVCLFCGCYFHHTCDDELHGKEDLILDAFREFLENNFSDCFEGMSGSDALTQLITHVSDYDDYEYRKWELKDFPTGDRCFVCATILSIA